MCVRTFCVFLASDMDRDACWHVANFRDTTSAQHGFCHQHGQIGLLTSTLPLKMDIRERTCCLLAQQRSEILHREVVAY